MVREIRIGVCTSSRQSNIQAFLSQLTLLTNVAPTFVELPYNDLDRFSLKSLASSLDAIILCHSIYNRRFAITDVNDALYDRFLPHAKRIFGKNNVIVIVHDCLWPTKKPGTDDAMMKRFQMEQPSTFECCSLAIICGKLDDRMEIDHRDWEDLSYTVANTHPHSRVYNSENVSSWNSRSMVKFGEKVNSRNSMVKLCLALLILPYVVWLVLKVLWRIIVWLFKTIQSTLRIISWVG